MHHGYLVGLFDVLGFEERLKNIGLKEMLARYEVLIEAVNYRKEHEQHVFGDLGFDESPYWSSDGDVFIFSKVNGAYASDSILLWANRTWPDVREKSPDEIQQIAQDLKRGWTAHPIPCDNFLDICNDLMCRGLEIGLPLRGAISTGPAVLDGQRNIFLGQPIIEAARLERGQNFIGMSFCQSAVNQTIPKRYLLEFNNHLKEGASEQYGGFVLDWPRHWRKTRSGAVEEVIEAMNCDKRYSAYYENTLSLIKYSEKFSSQFESRKEKSIRAVYNEFSFSNTELVVSACAVRRVLI